MVMWLCFSWACDKAGRHAGQPGHREKGRGGDKEHPPGHTQCFLLPGPTLHSSHLSAWARWLRAHQRTRP